MKLGATQSPGWTQKRLVESGPVDDAANGGARARVGGVELFGDGLDKWDNYAAPLATDGGMVEQDENELCFWQCL